METDYSSLHFQIQNLQHELEYLRKSKAVEVTRREHIETQFHRAQQDLAQSNAEQSQLKQRLRQSEYRIQELETELRGVQYPTWNGNGDYSSIVQTNIDTVDAEQFEDEPEIEILEIKPVPLKDNQRSMRQFPSIIVDTTSKTISGVQQGAGTLSNIFSEASSAEGSSVQTEETASRNTIESADGLEIQSNLKVKKYRGKHPSKPTICHLCGKQVPSLITHINLRHKTWSDSKRVWICLHCPKKYTSSSNLGMHYKSAHGSIRYICRMCPNQYTHPRSAKRHQKKVHGYTGKPIETVRRL